MNEVFVRIDGLNLFRIAQKLIDSGIMISNLKIKKSYMIFSLNEIYLKKLSEICKREHKYFIIVKNTKTKRFFAKLPFCLGGFLSFVLLFAFFYGIYGTIFSIKLTYDSLTEFDLNAVDDLLSKNNIMVGANKNNLKTSDIEKLILENSKDIAGCKVFYEGLNLNIVVYPAIVEEENLNQDLISKYNAIITKVDVFAGDGNVKVGALVKEGDVLIKNNNGAKGDVFGKVYFSSTLIYNEKQDIFEETGNIFYATSYGFGDVFVYKKAENCTFKNYNLETTKEILIKNLLMPIVKKSFTYKEMVIKEKIVEYEQVEDELKEKLKKETLDKVPKDAVAGDVTYSVVKENNYVRLDCFVECEMSLI